MPLDFTHPAAPPTLGRRPTVNAADRRSAFPRHELVAGLRVVGGYCSTMAPEDRFTRERVADYRRKIKRSEEMQTLTRPIEIDPDADPASTMSVRPHQDYAPFTRSETQRLLDCLVRNAPGEFTRGVLPEITLSREQSLQAWKVRVHQRDVYATYLLGDEALASPANALLPQVHREIKRMVENVAQHAKERAAQDEEIRQMPVPTGLNPTYDQR